MNNQKITPTDHARAIFSAMHPYANPYRYEVNGSGQLVFSNAHHAITTRLACMISIDLIILHLQKLMDHAVCDNEMAKDLYDYWQQVRKHINEINETP